MQTHDGSKKHWNQSQSPGRFSLWWLAQRSTNDAKAFWPKWAKITFFPKPCFTQNSDILVNIHSIFFNYFFLRYLFRINHWTINRFCKFSQLKTKFALEIYYDPLCDINLQISALEIYDKNDAFTLHFFLLLFAQWYDLKRFFPLIAVQQIACIACICCR